MHDGYSHLRHPGGEIAEIRFGRSAGRAPLTPQVMRYFEELVRARADEIVHKWIDFFVLNKSIRAFLDRRRFAEFRIEHGDLVWGDYDLCFPINDLYYNRILPARDQESAA